MSRGAKKVRMSVLSSDCGAHIEGEGGDASGAHMWWQRKKRKKEILFIYLFIFLKIRVLDCLPCPFRVLAVSACPKKY